MTVPIAPASQSERALLPEPRDLHGIVILADRGYTVDRLSLPPVRVTQVVAP